MNWDEMTTSVHPCELGTRIIDCVSRTLASQGARECTLAPVCGLLVFINTYLLAPLPNVALPCKHTSSVLTFRVSRCWRAVCNCGSLHHVHSCLLPADPRPSLCELSHRLAVPLDALKCPSCGLFSGWLRVGWMPEVSATCKLYLRHGSAWAVLRAATLRQVEYQTCYFSQSQCTVS